MECINKTIKKTQKKYYKTLESKNKLAKCYAKNTNVKSVRYAIPETTINNAVFVGSYIFNPSYPKLF